MVVTLEREPCWLLEAAELVYGFVNHISAEKLAGRGPYCIPAGEMARIQAEACRGLSLEDKRLQFYFRGIPLEGDDTHLSCLGYSLIYRTLELSFPDPKDMVRELAETWHRQRRAGYRVKGIEGSSVVMEPSEDREFMTLSQELAELPVPQTYQMQLLEVLSAFDEHLNRVAELLQPVLERLPALLEPWVRAAQPLVDQWEEFFQTCAAEEMLLRRCRVNCENYRSLTMAMRYISPALSLVDPREEEESLYLYMGVSKDPCVESPSPASELEEWEFSALRLIAAPARIAMLRAMMHRSMSAYELAQQLGLNSGSVFRDLNSLHNARLLVMERIGDRNCYRTNFQLVSQISEHMLRFLSDQ